MVGYPWIDYYKKNLIPLNPEIFKNEVNVLVTIQPPQGENTERIPDFVVDFLLSNHTKNMHFTFRVHPNDSEGLDYCNKR
jgi:hypothetical protein